MHDPRTTRPEPTVARARSSVADGARVVTLAVLLAAAPGSLEASSGTGTEQPPNYDNRAITNAGTTLEAGDPLSMASGEYYFAKQLLDLGGPLPLDFTIAYASGKGFPLRSGMPINFVHSHYATSLTIPATDTTPAFTEVEMPLGQLLTFELDAVTGLWRQHIDKRIRYQWIETATHFYLVDPQLGEVHTFVKLPPAFGDQISSIRVRREDRNGNTHHYTNLGPPATDVAIVRRGPLSVHDGLGRQLDFTFERLGQIQLRDYIVRVEDQSGRGWDLGYEVGPVDNPPGSGVIPVVTLRTLTDPLGGEWGFGYQGNSRIAALTHPEGNTPYSQTYSPTLTDPAVLTQSNALGDTWTLAVVPGDPVLGERIDLTQPDASVHSYFHGNNRTVVGGMLDELGGTATFTQLPERRAVETVVEVDGTTSTLGYHADSGLLASLENARGDSATHTWQEALQTITNPDNGEQVVARFFDRVRTDLPDGTFETTTYDGRGNAIGYTDPLGRLWTMTYDAKGQLLSRTNPAGGVETYAYDTAGNRLTSSSTDTGVTTFTYDAVSRVTSVSRPGGDTRILVYDDLDRVTERADELGVITRVTYDANGRPTAIVEAADTGLERTTELGYDALDRLAQIVDPAGGVTSYDYTYFDQPSAIELADGSQVTFEHDPRQLRSAIVGEAGERLEFERDAVGELLLARSPLAREATLERDELGLVSAIVDPLGAETSIERDELSRVVAVVDPLSRAHGVERDAAGQVVERSEPEATTTAYSFDGNGRLAGVTDPAGNAWSFAHTPMGRLAEVSDPLARVTQLTYDARGRLAILTPADGVGETLVYDPRDSLLAREHGDGSAQRYQYDALGRLVMGRDERPAASPIEVEIGYDSLDNPVATTFAGATFTATYDARSRLASLDYAGQMLVSYERDARGLVTRVSDDLSGAMVDLAYDADRALSSITRDNGHATTLSYDGKGRLLSLDHGALGRLDFQYDAADQPLAIAETGFPLDPADLLAAEAQILAYDAASQIASPGHLYDPRGRPTADPERLYSWDAADRLASFERDGSSVELRYGATGELRTRNVDGTVTEYHASFSVAGAPILAEREGGSFTRFYVALPDGTPLYFVDLDGGSPAVHYYHYGKVGETRATSDGAAAISNAYAYDGFGRLLGRSGGSDQIYAFGGQYGVRYDEEADLVHMRARWYDPERGRFLSPDPIFASLIGRNGQQTNPYHYVQGQVTRGVDPDGLDARDAGASAGMFTLDITLGDGSVFVATLGNDPMQVGGDTVNPAEVFLLQVSVFFAAALADLDLEPQGLLRDAAEAEAQTPSFARALTKLLGRHTIDPERDELTARERHGLFTFQPGEGSSFAVEILGNRPAGQAPDDRVPAEDDIDTLVRSWSDSAAPVIREDSGQRESESPREHRRKKKRKKGKHRRG